MWFYLLRLRELFLLSQISFKKQNSQQVFNVWNLSIIMLGQVLF